MDEKEQLVFDSEYACGVLGRGGEFVLVPLGSDLKADAAEMAHRLGWCYVSCLAVVDGQAGAKCEPHPDAAYTMLHAALAFAQQVAARLRAKHDDRVAWLDALYRLPDTRG